MLGASRSRHGSVNQAQHDYVERVIASNPMMLVEVHERESYGVIIDVRERRSTRTRTVGLIRVGENGEAAEVAHA